MFSEEIPTNNACKRRRPWHYSLMPIGLLTETFDPAEYLADDSFCAQEKIDGERRQVEIRNGIIRALNRNGVDCEAPAIAGIRSMLLDGEMIGDEFVAFDLLSLDGRDLTGEPLSVRLALLAEVAPCRIARLATGKAKASLLEAVRGESGEGVVFKRLSDTYPDARSYGVKFKFYRSESFVVASIDIAKASAAIRRNGKDCGRVSYPSRSVWPKVGQVIEVRFDKAHASGKLARPIFLGVRSDIPAEMVS